MTNKLQLIAAQNQALATKINIQGGFITSEDLPGLIAINRSMLLLVRCGCGRFL